MAHYSRGSVFGDRAHESLLFLEPRKRAPFAARSMVMVGQFFLVLTGACQFGHGLGGFTTNLIHSFGVCPARLRGLPPGRQSPVLVLLWVELGNELISRRGELIFAYEREKTIGCFFAFWGAFFAFCGYFADSPSRRASEHASAKRTKPHCPLLRTGSEGVPRRTT